MLKTAFFSVVCMLLTVSTHAQTIETSSISCIESMCGKANPFAHPFEENLELNTKTLTLLKSELQVEKPIKNYMGRLIHKTLISDKIYKYLLSQPNNFEVSAKAKSFILTFAYTRKISELTSAVIATADGFAFNQEALQKLLPDASSDEIAAIMSLSSLFSATKRFRGLETKPLEMLLKFLHPNKTLLEAQIIEANQILNSQKKIWSYMPKLSFLGEVDAIVQKASRGETLNYIEKKHFKEEMTNAASLEAIMAEDIQQKFSVLPLDISKILNGFKTKYESSQQYNLVKNPQTSKALLQENVGLCLTKLSYAYSALPNNQQLQNFKSMAGSILTTAKHMLEEKYKSSITEDNLGIEIAYPESRENMIADFNRGLKILTAESDQNFKLMKSFTFEDTQNLESFLVLASVFEDANVFSDLQTYCDRANAPYLDDAALSRLKILNLSWPTIQHPELGVGILAHEVGHIVSYHFGASEKGCLLAKQNYSVQYTEEDFADLFSAEVLSRLNYTIGSTKLGNLSCALLPYDQKYGWLAGTLTNSNSTDTHSSSFYRLLAFGTMTTGLTPQCTDHLKALNQNPFVNYCKWGKD